MYPSASNPHALRRSRQQSRSQSDPGHQYVAPPYTVQWPVPARRTTEPMGMPMAAGMLHPQTPSRSSSVERIGDLPAPHLESPHAEYQESSSPSGTSPPTSGSPRSPSPQRSQLQRGSSRQGRISPRSPQGSGPTKDLPQLPRDAALDASSAIAAPHPHPASWGQGQGQGHGVPVHPHSPPSPFQAAGMQRQGSHDTVHHQPPASVHQNSSATHLSRHHSYQPPTTSHHVVHPRSRSRPPSAASHRYASSITQPVYGHGSSASLNGSHTSLNGGVPSQRNHHATLPSPGTSTPYHAGTAPTHMPSGSLHKSRLPTHVPQTSTPGTTAMPHSAHKLKEKLPNPPSPPPAANEIHHSTQRPALPANYDGQTQTRYVHMLLALDDISPFFNALASFFTWILLAGFLLFPGTFASWKDVPAGSPQSDILSVVNNVSLYVIAWICTGIGACGMIWLWWRWRKNYVWINNRIFIPGCLNSLAGVISTLSSIYGAQAGVFGTTETSTIIVTGVLSSVCGILVLVYQFWLIRNLKLEHDHDVGVEMAGKHGEGILEEKRDDRNRGE